MKLLRTLRLDASDTLIFDPPAEPGEWAVSGAFAFWHRDPTTFAGKTRTAFRSGFLGVATLGWSTLVEVVDAGEAERRSLVELLAQRLVAQFGAPDRAAAMRAAEEEVGFAESLCGHPAGTLIAVNRSFDGGELRESFRSLRPRGDATPARAFAVIDVEGEDEAGDTVDLVGLAEKARG